MNKKKLQQSKKELDKLEKQAERKILKAYQETLREVRSTLAEAYAKYDMEMYEMQKYNRLANLEKQIIDEINSISRNNTRIVRKHISDTYEESFYRTAFYIETELQAKLAYPLVSKKVIEKVMENDMTGLNWVERMGRNRDETVYQIKVELSQGLIQGEGYQKMARRIKKRLDIDANKAMTIARTEGGRARSEANRDSMLHAEEKGVDMERRWVATLDERTRASHGELDGEVVKMDEPYSNGLMFPRDPMGAAEEVINCRCEEVAHFKGYEPKDRRVRLDEPEYDGLGRKIHSKIVPYETYEEWKKNRL